MESCGYRLQFPFQSQNTQLSVCALYGSNIVLTAVRPRGSCREQGKQIGVVQA
jgi:hypothetical protein